MRKEFKKREGKRFTVIGIVKRYGFKKAYKRDSYDPTILLIDVKDAETGQLLTDHLWMNVGKRIWRLNPQVGDTLQFDARVDSYYKSDGYDYHLEYPSKIKILNNKQTTN